MTIDNLKGLHDYLRYLIDENGVEYNVYEAGVLDLYDEMIVGKATRKDFLVFAICDMAFAVKRHKVPIKTTRWGRFLVEHKKYIEKEWESLLKNNIYE